MNIQDNKAIERLLKKQYEICSIILTELNIHKQKNLLSYVCDILDVLITTN